MLHMMDISIYFLKYVFNLIPHWLVKALIQMMAAAVAQRDMAYFTFDNKQQAEALQKMHQLLKGHRITVGE